MATNPLALSDEEFLNQPVPTDEPKSEAQSEPEAQSETKDEKPEEDEPAKIEESEAEPGSKSEQKTEDQAPENQEKPEDKTQPGTKEESPDPTKDSNAPPSGSKTEQEEKKVEKPADKPTDAEPDYKALYTELTGTFKANGRDITVKDVAEARQLMQMGANYTHKMQQLAPVRKIAMMLQNNGLLDESKLSFLIDLDKGDPEAIKKLAKDKGIDLLDIDTNTEPTYQASNHRVSDEEERFRTVLEDISSTEAGKQTLDEIDRNWDDASKGMIWENPDYLPIVNAHRESGIYARISDEINRRKTLGQLSAATPFMKAYYDVGEDLQKSGAFNDLKVKEPSGNPEAGKTEDPEKVVVTTRTAQPKTLAENDRAKAAAPGRSAPSPAKEVVNFLNMSDEDFMKADQLRGRV